MNHTLVLLHGFTGSPASFESLSAELPNRKIVAPALLGHADAPLTSRSWDQEIDRLADILRADAERGPIRLVGYSMGGRIALGLLARHPSIASSAVLIGASPGIADENEREARRKQDELRARMIDSEGLSTFIEAWEREPIFQTQRALPPEVQAKHRAIRLSHLGKGLAASLRVLGQGVMPNLWPVLREIDRPVTLVVGSEDSKLRHVATRMGAELPRSRLIVVPGVGHDVVLEAPSVLAQIISGKDCV
jgi:2-succinyl-6-hydroxy-2,4-cyclohexadiene-1-carboxylate synthase